MTAIFFQVSLIAVSIILIFIILIQRGRGGRLAGAFGGMGGQSAFGTKAGDVFTKITMVVATLLIVLSLLASAVLTSKGCGTPTGRFDDRPRGTAPMPISGGSETVTPIDASPVSATESSNTSPAPTSETQEQ